MVTGTGPVLVTLQFRMARSVVLSLALKLGSVQVGPVIAVMSLRRYLPATWIVAIWPYFKDLAWTWETDGLAPPPQQALMPAFVTGLFTPI